MTYDYVTQVFHVYEVCEWPLLQQMKMCFNVLKICYDVSMNQTDSFWQHAPFLSPLLIRNGFFVIIYSCKLKFLSTFSFDWMRGTLETKTKTNDYLICCKECCAGVWTVKWTGPSCKNDNYARVGEWFFNWESANQTKHPQSFGYVFGRYCA